MATPGEPLRILHDNASLIQEANTAPLGVDRAGRLFVIQGVAGRVTSFVAQRFSGIDFDLVIRQSVARSLAERSLRWTSTGHSLTERRTFIIALLARLEARGALTPASRALILQESLPVLEAGYEERYQALLESGESPLRAECKVAIEMSQDALIPAGRKIHLGAIPTPTNAGASGSYFIHSRRGEKIAIFKPGDEEPFAPHNCRDRPPNDRFHIGTCYEGIPVGQLWKREIAAYELGGTLAGVPETLPFRAFLPKRPGETDLIEKEGSIQAFVQNAREFMDEERPASRTIPVDEVHRVVLLDLLCGNQDRTETNILFFGTKLIPIDHGYAFFGSLLGQDAPVVSKVVFRMLFSFSTQLESAVSEEVRRDFMAIDIDRLVRKWEEEEVFSPEVIVELRLRHLMLRQALSITPPLTGLQIYLLLAYVNPFTSYIEKICQTVKVECDREMPGSQRTPAYLRLFQEKAEAQIRALFTEAFLEELRTKDFRIFAIFT